MNEEPPLLLLGAGGHARVLLELATLTGRRLAGVGAPDLGRQRLATWQGLPVIGDDEAVRLFSPDEIDLINGLGSLPGRLSLRQNLFNRFASQGYRFATLIHPSAAVSASSRLAQGVQVMAGAIIQTGAIIAENAIINTRASVDHDSRLGAHVHVAPGAVICGSVTVGEASHIGCGATVIQGVTIGRHALVGAGSVAICDLPDGMRLLAPKSRTELWHR